MAPGVNVQLTWDKYHERCVCATDIIHYSNIDTIFARIMKYMIYYQATRVFVLYGRTANVSRWQVALP